MSLKMPWTKSRISGGTYSLLPWFSDVLVRVEEGSYVYSLAPPYIAVNCPVEGELQAPTVKGTAGFLSAMIGD